MKSFTVFKRIFVWFQWAPRPEPYWFLRTNKDERKDYALAACRVSYKDAVWYELTIGPLLVRVADALQESQFLDGDEEP